MDDVCEPETSTASASTSSSSLSLGMQATIKMIRAKFSQVTDITTDQLDSMMQAGPEKNNVVLMVLDCREEAEFAVSHLPQAQRVDWKTVDPQSLLASLPADKACTVVCYCSLGYRSSALASRLLDFMKTVHKDAGQPVQVYNLEGSIFKWANEGRPMLDMEGQQTKLCHPYSFVFGRMLNKELRSSTPAAGK